MRANFYGPWVFAQIPLRGGFHGGFFCAENVIFILSVFVADFAVSGCGLAPFNGAYQCPVHRHRLCAETTRTCHSA